MDIQLYLGIVQTRVSLTDRVSLLVSRAVRNDFSIYFLNRERVRKYGF